MSDTSNRPEHVPFAEISWGGDRSLIDEVRAMVSRVRHHIVHVMGNDFVSRADLDLNALVVVLHTPNPERSRAVRRDVAEHVTDVFVAELNRWANKLATPSS